MKGTGMEIAEASIVLRRQAEQLTGLEVSPVTLAVALLVLGFRLATGANHQDALHGCKHLEDFKRARPQDLTRWIVWRFAAAERECFGELLGVAAAAERFECDAPFAQSVRALEEWTEVETQVRSLLAPKPICLCCENPAAHDRTLVVPMGGDPAMIAKLAEEYEHGF